MPRVDPSVWKPQGVDSLEPAANDAVRSVENMLVVAGPGAGKTELLAQRACYLLQTGLCPAPRRILAISFKRDAAKNLADRVALRCGVLARRFDSFTLDAFGKSLVDRFLPALPPEWRPHASYEVNTSFPRPDEMREWFLSVVVPDDLSAPNFRAMSDVKIRLAFERCTFGCPLPYEHPIKPLVAYYGRVWWRQCFESPPGTPSISFPMLNRLAAYLLSTNPKLLKALQCTYGYVFIDEFQDTTASQYDVVYTAFRNSKSAITAVGDSKQRIMLWAGAMENVFEHFEADFSAVRKHLLRNYRSTPQLIRVQEYIARAIESDAPSVEPVKAEDVTSSCVILEFATPEQEARYLAELIEKDLGAGRTPRDFCVLARQRTNDIIAILRDQLAGKGIRIRDESTLQDLVSEPAAVLILALLRLATRKRDPEAWEFVRAEVARINGHDVSSDGQGPAKEASRLVKWLKETISQTEMSVDTVPTALIQEVGEESLRVVYPQYRRGTFLADTAKKLGEYLNKNAADGIAASVSELIGNDIVPAMTVHKSKGLEFDTVVFLGLEDSQLWNFANQSDEEVRGFFVAFSRASHRVVFTFSDLRDGRFGRTQQAKVKIKDLYSILQSAGVQTLDLRLS